MYTVTNRDVELNPVPIQNQVRKPPGRPKKAENNLGEHPVSKRIVIKERTLLST